MKHEHKTELKVLHEAHGFLEEHLKTLQHQLHEANKNK